MKNWFILLLTAIETIASQAVFASDADTEVFHEFEWQGIKYRVIDEEKKTCMTKPRYNENGSLEYIEFSPVIFDYDPEVDDVLYIPEEVSDGIHTYSVVEIGDRSFEMVSNLVSVILPNSINKIGDYAFNGCKNLKSMALPEMIDTIPKGFVTYCISLGDLKIPENVNYIGGYAFMGCESIESLTLPSSLTYLGGASFCNCNNLTNIVIPDGVTVINVNTFNRCSKLKSVKLPSNLKKIMCCAFSDCGLEELDLPESLEEIDEGEEVKEPGISAEYYGAFSYSSLKRIVIPDRVKKIGCYAFAECWRLEYIKFPRYLDIIEDDMCIGCRNLRDIVFPDSIREIGRAAFYDCSSLKAIEIPEGTERIYGAAFCGCNELHTVVIPESLCLLRNHVFFNRDSEVSDMEIFYKTSVPKDMSDCEYAFKPSTYENGTLYVGTGGLEAARKTEPWKNFVNIKEMDFSDVDGISAKDANQHGDVELFDLHGRKIDDAGFLPHGVYILRKDGHTSKVLLP